MVDSLLKPCCVSNGMAEGNGSGEAFVGVQKLCASRECIQARYSFIKGGNGLWSIKQHQQGTNVPSTLFCCIAFWADKKVLSVASLQCKVVDCDNQHFFHHPCIVIILHLTGRRHLVYFLSNRKKCKASQRSGPQEKKMVNFGVFSLGSWNNHQEKVVNWLDSTR